VERPLADAACRLLQSIAASATDQLRSVHVVVSEGMELIIVLLVILANLVGLVWLQKWSGLT
jgi:hypothetical protein